MRSLFFLAAFAASFAVLHACEPASECISDKDCASGLFCEDGFCGREPSGNEGEGERPREGEGEGEEGEGEGEECFDGSSACRDDRNCPGGFCEIFDDEDVGCCRSLVCFEDSDCGFDERCDFVRGACVASAGCAELGCDDADATQCSVGPAGQSCIIPTVPASCVVLEDGAVTASGEPLQLHARGVDDDGGPHPAQFNFAASAGAVDSGGVLTASCVGPAPCVIGVTAIHEDTECTGSVRVLPPRTPGTRRVVLVDESTGAPLAPVAVVLVTEITTLTAATDADGIATFLDTAPATLTVEPPGHDWHTLFEAPLDVVIATRATPDETQVSGAKGFLVDDLLHSNGDITVSIAGFPFAGALIDVDPVQILGRKFEYNVELEGITDPGGQLVPLSSTFVLALGAEYIKGDWVAFGSAPFGWALGSRVRLSEFGPALSATVGSDDSSFGRGLAAFMGFMQAADAQVLSFPSESGALPEIPADGTPVNYDQWPFEEQFSRPSVRSDYGAVWAIEDLPCRSGADVDEDCVLAPDVVVAHAARVPGVGLVPLGVGAALNFADEPTEIITGFAPPHSGLEGAKMVHVAAALDLATVQDHTGDGVGVSVVILTGVAFGSSPSTGEFLDPRGGALAGSTLTLVAGPGELMRARMSGADGRWLVWGAGDITGDIDLEVISGADDTEVAARATALRMDAIDLPGAGDVIGALFSPGAVPLADQLVRFSTEPCGGTSATCTVE